jgi:high-affinity iron transporter
MALALTRADVEATQAVLDTLRGLLERLRAGYPATLDHQLRALAEAIEATKSAGAWTPYGQVPLAQRQRVNGAIGRALESLALAPALFSTDD